MELSPEQAQDLETRKRNLYESAQKDFNSRDMNMISSMVEGILKDFPPCMHVFNIVLKSYILLNDGEGIRKIIQRITEEGLRPNAITYSLLISYYRNMGRMEDAQTVFERMKASGIKSNTSAYTTLIAGYGAKGNFSLAEKLYHESQSLPSSKPDLHLFNTAIATFLAAGKPEEARAASNRMIELGLKPNFVTYKVFLAELLESSKFNEAERLYSAHLKDSEEMKSHDYGEVSIRFFKAGYDRKGLEVFEHALKRFGRTTGPAYAHAIDFYSILKEDSKIDELALTALADKSLLAPTSHALLRHHLRRWLSSSNLRHATELQNIYAKMIEYSLQVSPRIDNLCRDAIAHLPKKGQSEDEARMGMLN